MIDRAVEEVFHKRLMIWEILVESCLLLLRANNVDWPPLEHQRNRSINEVLVTFAAGTDKSSFP